MVKPFLWYSSYTIEYVHSIEMSLVEVSFQLWKQKLLMFLVTFYNEGTKVMG